MLITITQSERMWKEGNVHLVGFVISTQGGSKAFGATPAFSLLKQRYPSDTTKTLRELESKLQYVSLNFARVVPGLMVDSVMELELGGASSMEYLLANHDIQHWWSRNSYPTVEKRRDAGREFVSKFLAKDIRKWLSAVSVETTLTRGIG